MRRTFKTWVEKNVPKLQPNYNPNHGYEPYWPGGHWLYLDKELGPNETTTKTPLVCGEECNYLYTRVGKVCARTVDNKEYQQCVSIFGLCLGWWRDEFYRGFHTFDTYCKFLDAQCRTEYSKRWILVHEGECSHDIDTYFKPLHTSPGPLYRLSSYLTNLVKNYQSAGLESPLRQGVSLPDQTISVDGNLPLMLNIGIQPNLGIFPSNNRDTFRPTLPHKVKQYIHNFVKDMFLGNNSESINKK
ncbi:unnamed protein product [Pieris macdunnoughi]|uniref:Uncharacterized protein n=1 Tax=Pieris macdunnoughi TaxID=345717 RepID=A0A821P1D8_9NEOP|nr:unnamed protein product [Pieris macdunnoughi]